MCSVYTGNYTEMSPNVVQYVGAETTITPQWQNTNDVKLDLYFINGKVECVGIINGISGTSSISAKVTRNGDRNSQYFGRREVSNYEIKSKRYILKNYYRGGRFKLFSIKSL
ncbi:hypothetical protein SAMN02745784_02752 [Tissierella praeacuta DSM 18095]|uniref:Uncharacterized protein n=1 Tax=Tissierella praeacuta DSM 18095 TaxID=1123404 RepID=A0A1M4YRA4_9FIRM|nr:hypothetical protein [Tissierella praeacuta]TCU66978.1 hypothetical protein EV204_11388 [Tissierella praeacuta]SHF08187.1 hypothetical protein SAMN02745784_02752 [Tissierella praeacuta DSM 18095]SUP02451.1 Uncharacterised protein [Tissierella praeacuta]